MFENFKQAEMFFESRKSLGIKPGLDRIKRLLDLLNNPQDKIHAIHVAGTNGKGSTVQFIKNALKSNGYHAGVFTSPSFSGLTGHISINDTIIPDDLFLALCNEMYPAIKQLDRENMSPTEFEIITALAFLYFSKHVDVAIIETGMGGREDTTNCFHPIMSIITNISKDHTNFLGSTLEEIAYHKAGIIKQASPVIIGEMDLEALAVIVKEIHNNKTNSYQMGQDFTYKLIDYSKDSGIQHFSWNRKKDSHSLSIQMLGEHQVKNASIAYMAVLKLAEIGYAINLQKTKEAFENTIIPGRLEMVKQNPSVILDSAHNPAGIESLLQTVAANFKDKPNHLIFAAFKDKDLETMLEVLSGYFTSITVTTFDHPRAASAEKLYELTQDVNTKICKDWKATVENMKQKDSNYFITGSLHFIVQVRKYLNSH
ncbi:bifunctional folylpolyglutamate synthase/dihydrofolate synthase [Virgibacillus profundi]|uniref:tetrahydrofolate synthase n=1 Tax=Virgibacillus profundi TaxID=2024555 RepID=A0A2A2I8L3_9BACI|nr:folylpolyglutamate synthase/dihydrofolate synthase family protein [Virgibacillus profundi]PAV27624.1 bifunctional folylpolyglutamate synthase/dihydrofolate synthase [Virgibacillus profundi]PXY51802.1 bifunctional folylpolyglutamate synthase/dihydrofolate synthase [Virgibacillus profundi]